MCGTPPRPLPTEVPIASHESAPSQAVSVVVVDDHASYRRLVCRLLESAGFVVIGEAADAAQAIEVTHRVDPDVVLLDVMLPDRVGFDVADELVSATGRPVVVLTSSRMAEDFGDRIRSTSATAFIAKHELTAEALRRALDDDLAG